MRSGGVVAHVLPLTAARTDSWTQWRRELVKHFEDIVVIANTSTAELQSMSADTGMSEMLVVATKRESDSNGSDSAEILCVNLNAAPTTMAEGYALGREFLAIPSGRTTGIADWGKLGTRQTASGRSTLGCGWQQQCGYDRGV